MCVKGRNVRGGSAMKFSAPSLHGERAACVIFFFFFFFACVSQSLNFLLREKSKEL